MGSAQFFRVFELKIVDVYRDNHARAGKDSSLNDVRANAATANHHNCAARHHPGTVNYRPYPCRYAASDQHCTIERIIICDGYNRHIRDDRALAERRHQAELPNISTTIMHTKCAVE